MSDDRLSRLREYVQHKGTCAKWSESWEWPVILHGERACTCGLEALLLSVGEQRQGQEQKEDEATRVATPKVTLWRKWSDGEVVIDE